MDSLNYILKYYSFDYYIYEIQNFETAYWLNPGHGQVVFFINKDFCNVLIQISNALRIRTWRIPIIESY